MQRMTPDETAHDPRAQAALEFWFRGDAEREEWFRKDPSFDDEIRARFLSLYEEAARGALTWRDSPRSCLALIVLLDQFPRNMFRDTPRAFATDALALEAAHHAVARGYDRGMRPVERQFVYLPYQHAEALEEQLRGCELTAPLAEFPETADVYRYATAHRDIIQRFGRFPHRNGPGSSF